MRKVNTAASKHVSREDKREDTPGLSEEQTFNHLAPALFLLSRQKVQHKVTWWPLFSANLFQTLFCLKQANIQLNRITFPPLTAAVALPGGSADTLLRTNRHVKTEHRADGSTIVPWEGSRTLNHTDMNRIKLKLKINLPWECPLSSVYTHIYLCVLILRPLRVKWLQRIQSGQTWVDRSPRGVSFYR